MSKSKVIATFEGKGILINTYTVRDPFTKWKKIKIYLYDDGLRFDIEGNIVEVEYEQIEDIGIKLPRKIIEIAKNSLDDIADYGSITFKLPDEEAQSIGFAPETSIYGKTTINKFLKSLFQELLYKKNIKIQYARIVGGSVNPEVQWDDGNLVFAKKPIRKGVTVIEDLVLAIAVQTMGKPKVYDLFANIESVSTEKKMVNEEEKDVIEIKQLKGKETVNSYLYLEDTKILYILRYISLLTKYHKTVEKLLPKSSEELVSQSSAENWSGEKLKGEVEKLSPEEQEILTAIYTGIDSLELPSMMGLEVDEVEKVLESLIDKGFLDLTRIRKETDLTETGRAVTNYIITNF
ncbi:helix-turn-helix protein [Methanococcus voltae]|uniref:CheF family chemotaxis protein n=1 Tax=Methanococcus voltae TaxID=2188 RepID=UPI001AE82C82|nr:CheF family chemotaxis protein [Methanococcus voltae]MBP2142910.1 helix-turn-helix protein [Methanococcus voltae]